MRKNKTKGIKMTFKEFGWFVFFAVAVICFIFYFIYGFVFNCIFEWPIRWDMKTCAGEQVEPAKEKAAEKSINFVP